MKSVKSVTPDGTETTGNKSEHVRQQVIQLSLFEMLDQKPGPAYLHYGSMHTDALGYLKHNTKACCLVMFSRYNRDSSYFFKTVPN